MENYKLTYAIIKIAVENGIRYIQDNPKRGVRNLLDLGEYFAQGRFQKDFFELAHEILTNENSYYYDIIEDIVKNTNHSTITNYGINIGYNSLTYGANIIREHEKKYGYNVPWIIVFNFEKNYENHLLSEEVSSLITDGKKIGIYSYMILLNNNAEILDEVVTVIENNQDCSFIIYVNPNIINDEMAEKISKLTNVCISLLIENDIDEHDEIIEKAGFLRKYKCLYGGYTYYDDTNVSNISSGVTAKNIQSIGSNFAILIKKQNCSNEAAINTYDYIYKSRTKINTPVCFIDFYGDIARIDNIISDEPCFLSIDSLGQATVSNLYSKETEYNIRTSSLIEILSNI
ncbi:MAG: hypothetical protein WBJ13_11615 [Sedimentibacter sp.]